MTTVWSRAFHRKAATIGIILVILVMLFVTQVSADSLGPNLPGVGANISGIGTIDWSSPGNITAADASEATATVTSGGGITKYLRGTQFGFAIPAGSTIQGITVQIYRRTTGNPNPQLRDYVVQLVKGGTLVGDNKADLVTEWPHSGYVLASYGGPADKWSETWSVDDVNNANFGVALSVKNDNLSNNKTARVDYMQITVEYTLPDNPELTLVKTAIPTTYDTVGDVIGYTYELTNTGNVTLDEPFTITDDKATNEFCPPTATLAPGVSLTCTASYTITQADLDAGSVTNTAEGHGSFEALPVDSNQDSETVTASQNPELTLVKTAAPPTYDTVGDLIGYSFELTNTGNVTLDGPFSVTDDKATNESCPATASLAPGASLTCTASYTITQADLDAGSVTNTAEGHGSFEALPVDSNQDSETVTASQNPELTLVKTAAPPTYDTVGDLIGYSFELTNTGNVTLDGPFSVTDDKATNESCPATASLAPGASLTCSASYTITQGDLDAGFVTNTAQGHSSFEALPVDSNQDSETVFAQTQGASLTLVKSATQASYDAVGDLIDYSFELTNNGNVTLSGPFTVTDNKASDETCPPTATLAPGASLTCTASYTITQADLDAGSVTNIATGHGVFGLSPVESNQDSETVTAIQNPALTLLQTPTPATFMMMGDVIDYSYHLTNGGNVTLAGPFTVADNLVTVTCPATASLAPGASLTCTASYTILIDDVIDGSVINTASGSGFFGGNPVNSAPDQATVDRLSILLYLPFLARY